MFKKKEVILLNDITISYIDNELLDKNTILFVHGWAADKYNLQSIFSSLSDDYRIISLDLPGFGESSKPYSVYGSDKYAEIIYDFLNKLNITRVNYVGHSFGGKIGILFSVLYPDYIKRLILIDSSGIRAKRSILWYLKVGLYKISKFLILNILKNKEILDKFRSNVGSDDYKKSGEMKKILVKTVNEDFTSLLKEIKCPVFLYWGEKDSATPLWMAEKMKKLIPDVGLYVVKNGSHFSFLEDNRIISIINSFCSIN